MSEFALLKCRLAGMALFFNESTAFVNPATPAAVSVCPILVFTEPTAQKLFFCVYARNDLVKAVISIGSPIGVAVPWHSTKPMVSGLIPAIAMASEEQATCPLTPGAEKPMREDPSLFSPVPRITA